MPQWIRAVLGMVMVMWIGTAVFYHFGADGVSVSGSDFDFEREFDYALFKVNDKLAIYVSGPEATADSLEVIPYEPGDVPFRWFCGGNQATFGGLGLLPPLYRKDDLIFSGSLSPKGGYAVNIQTGEVYQTAPPQDGNASEFKALLKNKALYAKHGIDPAVDAKTPLTPAVVAKDFEGIGVTNESCIVFNAAYIFIVLLLLSIAGLGWVIRKVRGGGAK